MKKSIYILLLFLGITVGIFVGTYWFCHDVKTENYLKADYSIASSELYDEFSENRALAAVKYQAKIIKVTGTVQEVYSKSDDKIKIILRDKNVFTGVSCIIEKKKEQISQPLKLGASITLQGLCAGIGENVILMNCVVVKG